MSRECWLEFEGEDQAAGLPEAMESDGSAYGIAIGRNLRWLDGVSDQIGCGSLSQMAVAAEVLEEAAMAEEDGAGRVDVSWPDADELEHTIQALTKYFDKLSPSVPIPESQSKVTPADLLWDLRAFDILLKTARDTGRRIRVVFG